MPLQFSEITKAIRSKFDGRGVTVLSALLLLFIIAIFIRSLGEKKPVPAVDALMAALPEPDANSPAIIVSATKGEFPQDAARLVTNGAPSSGAPSAGLFLPILDSADAMVVIITERSEGFAVYGAFTLTSEEHDALSSGLVPESWKRYFLAPELLQTDRQDLYQMTANNAASPIYLKIDKETAFLADSLTDVDRIMGHQSGNSAPHSRKWSVEPSWGGHVFLYDGGAISSMFTNPSASLDSRNAISFEAAWTSSTDKTQTTAKWQMSGLDHIMGASFPGSLKPHDWSGGDIFIPDPLILSIGINMPNPGRNFSALPSGARYIQEQMRKMGLKNAEIQTLFSGPATISLGGRTQLLWFDLPGIVLDIPGRGEAAYKLIDKFWSDIFTGAEPRPVDGFSRGGVADLPFTVLGAANDSKAVIGLVSPETEQNWEIKDLLAATEPAVAWLYIDFPRFGASLAEVPALNSMIYEDEEGPLDEESAIHLKDAMTALGRVFVTFGSASAGSALCYY